MPRNNGIYSPPPGTGGTPQTVISSAMFNAWVADISADQNNPRPVITGGTGAATAESARANLGLSYDDAPAQAAFRHNLGLGDSATRDVGTTAGTVAAGDDSRFINNPYGRSNIVGTVSQSGGVPTGEIIERGSNANGEYVRYADGTQIALRNVVATDAGVASPFAATFSTEPSVLGTTRTTSSGALGGAYVVETRDITVSQAVVKVTGHGPTSIVAASASTSVIAIGRWF